MLLHAIHEVYRNILPAGIYPVALLFITLSCEEVDVNVHPAKIEVRFRHSQFVHDFTRDVLRQALGRARPVPSFSAPAGSAAQEAAPAAAINGAAAAAASAVAGGPMSAPRAVIPPMPGDAVFGGEEFGLTPMPVRPEAQRFQFDGGQSMPAGFSPTESRSDSARQPRSPPRRPAKCRPAPLASPAPAAGAGERQLYRGCQFRGVVDHRSASWRTSALFEQYQGAPRRPAFRAALAGPDRGGAGAAPARHSRAHRRGAFRERLRCNAHGLAKRGHSGGPRGNFRGRCPAPLGRNTGWHRSRAPGHLHRFAAIENRGLDGLGCHAA